MIRNIRHRGLRALFETGSAKGIPAAYADKLRRVLFTLNTARALPEAADLPGYGLHQLTGDRRGVWSITVSRNWRITFTVDGIEAVDVDFEDYH